MFSDRPVITVENLGKRYEIYERPSDRLMQMLSAGIKSLAARARLSLPSSRSYFREFWALRDVSFELYPGESLGIIGRNGSGKSTLLQILAGTLTHTVGDVRVDGRVAALLELGSGFNPEFTGRENVLLNARILGLSRETIERRYEEIVEFADIGSFINQPVKMYSSGMFVRLAFAVQAHLDAAVVIIDEALAVGDVFFRQKCYKRLEALRESGAAIILVSHSMPEIEQFCDRALLIDHGRLTFSGSAIEASKRYYLIDQVQKAPGPPPTSEGVGHATNERAHSKNVVSNGQARWIQTSITDEDGNPNRSFKQGQTALFRTEFEILADIEVPVSGIVLRNDKNVIVHGKNSWQYDTVAPLKLVAGSRLISTQAITLKLAPGEYTFETGLVQITAEIWRRRREISYDLFNSYLVRVCHVPEVGAFTIAASSTDGVMTLTHHGIADLPGNIRLEQVELH